MTTGRPEFEITVCTPLERTAAWNAVWDLDSHTRTVPFTTVRQTLPAEHGRWELGVGAVFDGRTRLGPMVVHDLMRVEEWCPPYRARITKIGSPLRGSVLVEFSEKDGRTRVNWRQSVTVRRCPDALVRLVLSVVRAGYRSVLERLLTVPEPGSPHQEYPRGPAPE